MHTLAMTIGAVAVAAWVYLLLGRGGFWREAHKCSTWSNCGKAQGENQPSVAAVVPARNERATIARCVMSLFGQEYGEKLHVIAVDDESTDGTAEAVWEVAGNPHPISPPPSRCAQGSGQAPPGEIRAGQRDDRLTVISGRPRPVGWSGKVWAMHQGIEAARAFAPTFFLLTDADVVHAPDDLTTLVSIAEDGNYDLASFMVRLHCESAAERLLIPAFVFFFFLLYPPRWIADPRRATAGAAGGCMLVRVQALERAGGMAAVRGEVIDDCALARAIKRTGGRVWLGLSSGTASVRTYGSLREIGRMIARTAFKQLRHSALLLAGALAGMAIAFLAPIVLLFTGHALPIALGAAAWLLMTIAYLPMVRFYRLSPLWAAALPFSALFYMGATVWSAVKFWAGRGGEWKGRVQDSRE